MINMVAIGIILSSIIIIPVSIKWELNKNIIIPFSIILGAVSGVLIKVIDYNYALSLRDIIFYQSVFIFLSFLSMMLWRFYRDPRRIIMPDPDAVLSPADGKIIYVKKISNGEIPLAVKNNKAIKIKEFTQTNLPIKAGYQIGISMSFLDVHVNRSPISGTVETVHHIKGKFSSLKNKEAIFENERTSMIISGNNFKVGVVQIASRLVRMIVPYVKPGDTISIGDKIGRIRFGSQVDIIIPDLDGVIINVKENELVKAGISRIATRNCLPGLLNKTSGEKLYEISESLAD